MGHPQSSSDVFKALRAVIDLPENVASLTLKLEVDTVATVDMTYFPTLRPVVDVSHLASTARESAEDVKPVSKRFRLVEIED